MWLLAPFAALTLVGCAGGAMRANHCEVEVEALKSWDTQRGLYAAYQVTGRAGSEGKVWLAARNPSGSYVSGEALRVGPGPFRETVDLDLDRRPAKFLAVLQVAGKRCTDDAPEP